MTKGPSVGFAGYGEQLDLFDDDVNFIKHMELKIANNNLSKIPDELQRMFDREFMDRRFGNRHRRFHL